MCMFIYSYFNNITCPALLHMLATVYANKIKEIYSHSGASQVDHLYIDHFVHNHALSINHSLLADVLLYNW